MPPEQPQSGAPLVLELDDSRVNAVLRDSYQTAILLGAFNRLPDPAHPNSLTPHKRTGDRNDEAPQARQGDGPEHD